MQYRRGEEEKLWFRAERIFQIGSDYYFSTREGRDIGPFSSEKDATSGVKLYINCLSNKKFSDELAHKLATESGWSQKEL